MQLTVCDIPTYVYNVQASIRQLTDIFEIYSFFVNDDDETTLVH